MDLRLALIAAALLLGACDGGAPAPERRTASIGASTELVDRLRSLDEMNRGLALRRAVQDSGLTCKKPEESGYQEDFRNLSMWTLRCSDRRAYALFIAPNGDVQVRRCDQTEQLDLPACRFEGAGE